MSLGAEVLALRGDDPECELGAICVFDLHDTDSGQHISVRGRLLGFASSRRRNHNHQTDDSRNRHPAGQGGQPAVSACSACRWFEVRIIRPVDPEDDHDLKEYVVSFKGATSVRGEDDRETLHVTRSPHTVIEVLTQHRNGETFIPRTSRLALSEAANLDAGIEAAWIDRAVT